MNTSYLWHLHVLIYFVDDSDRLLPNLQLIRWFFQVERLTFANVCELFQSDDIKPYLNSNYEKSFSD